MAAILAILTLARVVQAWHVQLVALGIGVAVAISTPARQAFVHGLVGPAQLRNAVSLNSAAFQLAGLVGPAASGLLLGAVFAGLSFVVTAVCYLVPVATLARMRADQLRTPPTRLPR